MLDNVDTMFRHELKYVISAGELEVIKGRVTNLLSSDEHAINGTYNIRSLYFDDYNNRCYHENENGTDPREKFRIRIYNHSVERITLECKRKERGKTLKISCPLSLEQTKLLVSGIPVSNIAQQHPLLQKLTSLMLLYNMKPVVIVEYDRLPYVYKNGNVRITFDKNICSSSDVKSFMDNSIKKRPVMPLGNSILEVKYDEYLPDFIYNNLQINSLRQTAFSKYYICRKLII